MTTHERLLTTGEAAAVLGSSRQHVTDLCRSGALPFRTVGTHRRISRADIERLATHRRTALPEAIDRQRLRSLWLHRAVAGRLAADPDGVLAVARANVARARALSPRATAWLDTWQALLDDPELAMERLTAQDADADELRQSSPFAGVLDEADRARILDAFAAWWRSRRAP